MSFVRQPVRNYWITVCFRPPVGLSKAYFFEIPQAKVQCQDTWEVLSILQSTSISTSHPCWVPLAATSTRANTLPASQTDLTDFRGAWAETCQEQVFGPFCKSGFQSQ